MSLLMLLFITTASCELGITEKGASGKDQADTPVSESSGTCAFISADRMNVFYIGVDNPISIATGGVDTEDLNVKVEGAGGNIQKTGANTWTVRVQEPGTCSVIVSGPLDYRKTFQVKRVPDPKVGLGDLEGTGMSVEQFKRQDGVDLYQAEFGFISECALVGFTLHYIPQQGQGDISVPNKGSLFNDRVKRLVKKAEVGDVYVFDNVQVRCTGDEETRVINNMAFRLR